MTKQKWQTLLNIGLFVVAFYEAFWQGRYDRGTFFLALLILNEVVTWK